ncbi:MAG: acyltransferase [Cyanothece sp. SIO2G6]|nr:acyltransferase [Cyanothece sp. SIO2G6]
MPLALGFALRRFAYRYILGDLGKNAKIHPRVEFQSPAHIKIGNNVKIRRDVHLRRIGNNSSIHIHDSVSVDSGVYMKTYRDGSITIGEETGIGPYTCLSGGNITIGPGCLIASHVSIYANNHIFTDPAARIRGQGSTHEGITIGEDCWLGTGVKVLDGVTIGKGSVIGAGAVVTKSIPPYSIAVGVPAKVIGQRGEQPKVAS